MGLEGKLGRLRAKFHRETLPQPAAAPTTPAAVAQLSSTVAPPDADSSSLEELLWNEAYDQARLKDASAVDTYEKIISSRLQGKESIALDSQPNIVSSDVKQRRGQMQELIRDGLRRTDKIAAVKGQVAGIASAASPLRAVIDSAVQASPAASLAWVGACFALEILMNSSTQTVSNRSGLRYVTERLDWYCQLTGLLLDQHHASEQMLGLQSELRRHIVQLYADLLMYQIQSVCMYFRHGATTFMRDMLKLDDWDSKLDDIRAAEAVVREDAGQYNTEQVKVHLAAMAQSVNSQKTNEDRRCLADLCGRDPRHEKSRIESLKGGLLEDCYRWVFSNAEYQKWQNDDRQRVLWVSGGPGQGKTMLLCGIIDGLNDSIFTTEPMSYFFCQKTDSAINSATAVLRGIIYMLCRDRPDFLHYVRKEYDNRGRAVFEDANAWFALQLIFMNILASLEKAYIIVDALDECETDRDQLLQLILHDSAPHRHVKWVFSGRDWPEIERAAQSASDVTYLRLTPDMDFTLPAVTAYIQAKVDELAKNNGYSSESGLKNHVCNHLSSKANATFLWVALVCQGLRGVSKRHVLRKLENFNSPDLDNTYDQIIRQIEASDDAHVCCAILATVACANRPLKLAELAVLVEDLEQYSEGDAEILDILQGCYSLVKLQAGTLYFVHQSAQEHVVGPAAPIIFPQGLHMQHYRIFQRSLMAMSRTLGRNIYNLPFAGTDSNDIPRPTPDPLAAVEYSCIFWLSHLDNSKLEGTPSEACRDEGPVHTFLSTHLLHWLEALSVLRNLSSGIHMLIHLQRLAATPAFGTRLRQLSHDALEFVFYFQWPIENAVLQLYSSAILFSPQQRAVRGTFMPSTPSWVLCEPVIEPSCSSTSRTFEGHSDSISALALSLSSPEMLASGSIDCTVMLWDCVTGQLFGRFDGHIGGITQIVFAPPDGQIMITASVDRTLKVWDVSTKQLRHTLKGHILPVRCVAVSPKDKHVIASGSDDETVMLWDITTGLSLLTLAGHVDAVLQVDFSLDGLTLASSSSDHSVALWNVTTGQMRTGLLKHKVAVQKMMFLADGMTLACITRDAISLRTLETGELRHECSLLALTYAVITGTDVSPDGRTVAVATMHGQVNLWDTATMTWTHCFHTSASTMHLFAFSPRGDLIACASQHNIGVWSVETGQSISTLQGHTSTVTTLQFLSDGAGIASGSSDRTVKLWTLTGQALSSSSQPQDQLCEVFFTQDGDAVISQSRKNVVKIWNPSGQLQGIVANASGFFDNYKKGIVCMPNGKIWIQTFESGKVTVWDTKAILTLEISTPKKTLRGGIMSPNGHDVVYGGHDGYIRRYDEAGQLVSSLESQHIQILQSIAISRNGQMASQGADGNIQLWSANEQPHPHVLTHIGRPTAICYSPTGQMLASASSDHTVKLWSTQGKLLFKLHAPQSVTKLIFSPDERTLIGSMMAHRDIMTWDIAPALQREEHLVDKYVQGQTAAWLSSEAPRPDYLCNEYLGEPWIYYRGQRLIWLPPEYRTAATAVRGTSVALGTPDGRVTMLKFDPDKLATTP